MENTKQQYPTEPTCEGHNWELAYIQPEWSPSPTVVDYREISVVICTFCGVVRKTIVRNL